MRGIIIFIVIVAVLAAAGYFGVLGFVNIKGKDIFAAKIKENFGAEAQIGSFSFKFPFNIEIKDFSCEDISFKRANIFGGVYNPFIPRLTLNSVTVGGLKLKAVREKGGIYIKPIYTADKTNFQKQRKLSCNKGFIVQYAFAEEAVSEQGKANGERFSLKINNFHVKDGEVEFVDLANKDRAALTFKDVDLRIRNFMYPQLTKFNIELNTRLDAGQEKESNFLNMSGWVDYSNRDMNVNISAEEIDCYAFYDYYPNFWKPERFGVEDAVLLLRTNVNSQHNDLVIDGTLSLERIKFGEETEENANKMNYLKTILALLKGDKDKPALNLKLKTKMDSPKLDFSSVKNNFKGIVSIGTSAILGEVFAGEDKEEDESDDDEVDRTVNAIKDAVSTLKDLF